MITVSEDVASCPSCDAPAVKDSDIQRHCNTCGLGWEYVSAEEELDRKETKEMRSRGWLVDNGRSTPIEKGQTRW